MSLIHTSSMRPEYIKLIKEYITNNPEYRFTLNELKNKVLAIGATEDEFEEAIKEETNPNFQFQNPQAISQVQQSIQTPSIIQKIISFVTKRERFLAYTFVAILIFTSALIYIFGQNLIPNNEEFATIDFQSPLPAQSLEIVKQVYANMSPIDPDTAFSVPNKPNVPLVVTSKPKKEIFGFFPYWMIPKASEIDISLLSTISIFGLEVDGRGNIVKVNTSNEVDPGWQMWMDPELDQFIKRAKNKDIKISLTFKSFNNDNIETLVNSDDAQKTFISNALYLFSSKNLNGINLDFEYLGTPTENVRDGFTRLVTNLNAELKRQYPKSVLTIDTYATEGNIKRLIDLKMLEEHVDAYVVMGYDFHTIKGIPGPISPMGGEINLIGSIQGYLEKVKPEKIILAVPYYGYDWPEDGRSDGKILPYSTIIAESRKHTINWSEISQTPYYSYVDKGDKRIVHFDNVRSLGIKFDYVNDKNLKGIGIWALGYDGYNSDLQRLIIDKF